MRKGVAVRLRVPPGMLTLPPPGVRKLTLTVRESRGWEGSKSTALEGRGTALFMAVREASLAVMGVRPREEAREESVDVALA